MNLAKALYFTYGIHEEYIKHAVRCYPPRCFLVVDSTSGVFDLQDSRQLFLTLATDVPHVLSHTPYNGRIRVEGVQRFPHRPNACPLLQAATDGVFTTSMLSARFVEEQISFLLELRRLLRNCRYSGGEERQ